VNVRKQSYITGRGAGEIAASIERGIRESRLPPGSRLPTVRELAARLEVSPTTVAAVYRDLGRRGMVSAAGRLGTTVSFRPPVATSWRPVFAPGVRDLASGNPDPELLPDLGEALVAVQVPPILYGQRANDPELVEVARGRLHRDGVAADHLTVVGGAMDGVERALQAHLRTGDRVAVEDPGYPGVLDLLATMGLVPCPVAVDDRGPDPQSLAAALGRGVSAFVLSPRAENPYGSALDRARAGELRRVLDQHPEVLVVEDDHAGEIAGTAPFSVSRGERERWVVIRSVSKSLGPDLRLAVVGGDATTIARVEGRRLVGTGWVSHLLQRLVVWLWSDPATPARLERAARTYAERRGALLDALAGHGIAAHGRSGFNVWVPVAHEDGTVAALLDAGWGVLAGERFRIGSGRAIRVSAATLAPADAERFAADLAAALSTAPARIA